MQISDIEALDGSEDIVGGFCSSERPWFGIVLIEEAGDGFVQRVETAVGAAFDLALGQNGEEAFDLVDP